MTGELFLSFLHVRCDELPTRQFALPTAFSSSCFRTNSPALFALIVRSPVEVPNVRKRDIALFPLVTPWEVGDQVLGITAKKEDAYLSEIVELSGDESMLQAGHGHHFLAKLPLNPPPWLLNTPDGERIAKLVEQLLPLSNNVASSGSVCTIRARIRHRFVDEVAQLRFHGENPNASWTSPFATSKGWFAPYFHATNRTPFIPRLKEPLVVLFDGPPLYREEDYALGVRRGTLRSASPLSTYSYTRHSFRLI